MIGVLLLALALINYHVNPSSATEDLQKHKASMNSRNVQLASTDKDDVTKSGGAEAQKKQAMFEAEERVCCISSFFC